MTTCCCSLSRAGLLEVIRIRRAGYPIRMEPQQFYGRYAVIDAASKDPASLIASIGMKGEWQIGKTKFFLRDGMFQDLELRRGEAMEHAVRAIQGMLKAEVCRRSWMNLR